MNNTIDLTSEVEGYFTIEIFKVDSDGREIEGTRREPVPTFKNLITNAGLNRIGTDPDYLSFCQVGSGSTPATVTDGVLVARIAGTNAATANNATTQPTAPYFAAMTKTFQFGVGVATGNISEVGIGWATAGSLFSRALVVDGAGTPTTITVLADEVLQVTYQFRYYAPVGDLTGSIVLNGNTYNWVSRPALVTGSTAWQIGPSGTSAVLNLAIAGSTNGAIAAVTGQPSGTSLQSPDGANAAYSAGSYKLAGTVTWPLDRGNDAAGIGAFYVKQGVGTYQIGFTPKIPKTNAQTLSLTVSHSWARKAV